VFTRAVFPRAASTCSALISLTLAALMFCLPAGSAHAQQFNQGYSSRDYDFNLPCLLNGEATSFDDLAESGRSFMLVWWKSDCPHCQRELPYVQKLADLSAAGKVDLAVVSINVGRDIDDCLALADKRKLSFPILSDPEARRTNDNYNVWGGEGLPCTYLFGPGGSYKGSLHAEQRDYVDKVLSKLGLAIVEHNPAWDPVAKALGQRVKSLVANRAAWLVYDKYVEPLYAAAAQGTAASAGAADAAVPQAGDAAPAGSGDAGPSGLPPYPLP
jgi:thiol-disulfide isomerase/thioredoxin